MTTESIPHLKRSVIAWTLSHKPFWKGLIPAVVHVRTLSIDITSLISSELNSPPLSVNIAPITSNTPIQFLINASITSFGFFLLMNTHTVYRYHMSIMCKIHLSFHFFRSIATFSLNTVAKGRATTGLGGVLANNLQISHFRSMSDNVP